jgi:mono/diheme cytochrome c family protein
MTIMKRRDIDKTLEQALRRFGNVSPQMLQSVRDRVRQKLKVGNDTNEFASSSLDASAPSLWPIRWPILVAGVTILVVVGAISGVKRWGVREWSSGSPYTITVRHALPRPNSHAETKALLPQIVPPVSIPQPKRILSKKQPADVGVPRAQSVQHAAATPSTPGNQLALLPAGAGRVILDRACNNCHPAAGVAREHFATKAEYSDLVARMVTKGAPLSEQEIDTLATYLFEHFGVKQEPGDTSVGRALLERSCTTCHSLNGIELHVHDSVDPYRDLISRMISHGATLSDEEAAILAQYLYATYGTR